MQAKYPCLTFIFPYTIWILTRGERKLFNRVLEEQGAETFQSALKLLCAPPGVPHEELCFGSSPVCFVQRLLIRVHIQHEVAGTTRSSFINLKKTPLCRGDKFLNSFWSRNSPLCVQCLAPVFPLSCVACTAMHEHTCAA